MWLLIAQLKASTLLPTNGSSAIGNGGVADNSIDVGAATEDTAAADDDECAEESVIDNDCPFLCVYYVHQLARMKKW